MTLELLLKKWNPTNIRNHLTAVQNQLYKSVQDHISDCTCRGCEIKRDNVSLLEASSELRNFTELKIVSTTKKVECPDCNAILTKKHDQKSHEFFNSI